MKIEQGIITKKINDSKNIALAQVEYLGNVIDNVVIVEPKGFHTRLKKGTQCLLIKVSQNQNFLIPIENINRPKDLEDGETATGNFDKNAHIKYKNNGDVVVRDGENNSVQYQAMDAFIQTMVGLINTELGKIASVVPAYSAIKTDLVVDTSASKIEKLKVE